MSCDGCVSKAPFYSEGNAVQEEHGVPTIKQVFVTAIACSVDFAMPACNVEATVHFAGVCVLQVGSYLWNATFGYLLVTGFDAMGNDVKVKNTCRAGNALPGTVIPRRSLFNVVDPPPVLIT